MSDLKPIGQKHAWIEGCVNGIGVAILLSVLAFAFAFVIPEIVLYGPIPIALFSLLVLVAAAINKIPWKEVFDIFLASVFMISILAVPIVVARAALVLVYSQTGWISPYESLARHNEGERSMSFDLQYRADFASACLSGVALVVLTAFVFIRYKAKDKLERIRNAAICIACLLSLALCVNMARISYAKANPVKTSIPAEKE
jgi:hypothetical protein